MKNVYDITNPETAREWLRKNLNIEISKFMENQDIDAVIEKCSSKIDNINLENIEFVLFHVTTNDNRCDDIKKFGLHNLQWVLKNNTSLSRFLQEKGVIIDIENKELKMGDKNSYSLDCNCKSYENAGYYRNMEGKLKLISKKIYSSGIEAFFSYGNIHNYSCISGKAEFLYNLSELGQETTEIVSEWQKKCKSYIVKFKCKLEDFDYQATFGMCSDLKKWLVEKACESVFWGKDAEIFACLKYEVVIPPQNITIVPGEEW